MKTNLFISFLTFALLAFSCKPNSDRKVEGDTVEAKVPQGPTTQIRFHKDDYNFGKVTQGQIVEYSFEFTNVGKEPLIISECHASCGCTVPEWPRDPIAPGEKSRITTKFNTAGKSGEQKKVVTVTANTEPFETYISISGYVEAPTANETKK